MDGMHKLTAHRRVDARRFVTAARSTFVMRVDGSSWPRWRDTWGSAVAYFEGVLRSGRRKTMRGIARRVELPHERVEQFIRESPWRGDALQEHLVKSIPQELRNPRAVLVVDDVGLVKQGDHSVGVHRQYSGALGKVGNCQVAVDLVHVVPGKRFNGDQVTWPLGMRLYLPEAWTQDPARRESVGIPDDVVFQTKPEIALGMIERARAASVEHEAVGGDAGYGDGADFRRQLREWREPYVLGVTPSKLRVVSASARVVGPERTGGPGAPRKRATYEADARRESPAQIAGRVKTWERVEWSEGSKGRLSGLFHRERVRVVEGDAKRRYVTDEEGWLVLEKRRNELKAYVCWGLDDASLEHLVEIAHSRWAIEQFHRDAKQELALDDFEGRTWNGWNHHVGMVLLAHAFVSTLRARHGVQGRLPSFGKVIKALVHEIGTQILIDKHAVPWKQAARMAADVIRGLTEWG